MKMGKNEKIDIVLERLKFGLDALVILAAVVLISVAAGFWQIATGNLGPVVLTFAVMSAALVALAGILTLLFCNLVRDIRELREGPNEI